RVGAPHRHVGRAAVFGKADVGGVGPHGEALDLQNVPASKTLRTVSLLFVMKTWRRSGVQALVAGPMPVGSVARTLRSSALRTTFVLAAVVCTQTSRPSGDTRSMCGRLSLGKSTVRTTLRAARST